jgi:hypothetical protein
MDGIRIIRSDRSPVLRGQYPNIDGNPIPGFEFNGTGSEEWLIVVKHNYTGDYDPRYYQIIETEDAVSDRIQHPDYPGVGQWVIRETLVKLDLGLILNNLEDAENLANNKVMPTTKQIKNLTIVARALARKILNNSNISNAEQKSIDYINNTGKKFLDNKQVRKDKKTLIEPPLNEEPDMNTGWTIDTEPEVL